MSIKKDLKYFCEVNDFNNLEREIAFSICTEFDYESLHKKLETLASDIEDGNSTEITNDILPTHYSNNKYEPIKFITKWDLNFCKGNIIKYLTRYKSKNKAVDLGKVSFYAHYLKFNSYDGVLEIK